MVIASCRLLVAFKRLLLLKVSKVKLFFFPCGPLLYISFLDLCGQFDRHSVNLSRPCDGSMWLDAEFIENWILGVHLQVTICQLSPLNLENASTTSSGVCRSKLVG